MSRLSILVMCLFLALSAGLLMATTSGDLEKATKRGKIVFLLVTEAGGANNAEARQMAEAASMQVKKSAVIELDRSDITNSELVTKYRLAGAPLPLIMILAGNGAIAGGIQVANTNAEQLVKMVPTEKKAEVLKALQSGQSVLVTASSKRMPKESKVTSACAAACGQMAGKCAAVQVDLEDTDELSFLNELKISPEATEPVTVVINAQGQVTGSFQGAVEVGNLVQAASKKAGGCCSGKSSCGPLKK